MTIRTRWLLLPLALGAIAFGACSHSSAEQQSEPSSNPGMNPTQEQGMDAGTEMTPANNAGSAMDAGTGM